MPLSFGFYFFSYLYLPKIYKVVYKVVNKDINYLLLVGVFREELCQKEECFTVPEWSVVTAGNSRMKVSYKSEACESEACESEACESEACESFIY